MKTIARTIAAVAALSIATGAFAEAHEEAAEAAPNPHFQFEGTLDGFELAGGVGGEVFGGAWKEVLTIGSGENTTTVMSTCIGMDQPESAMFDRHFTCSQQTEDGASKGAVLFGCNVENEAGNEMSCYGFFEGKEGAVEGHDSLQTAYYSFMPDGTGKVVGSGQWIR